MIVAASAMEVAVAAGADNASFFAAVTESFECGVGADVTFVQLNSITTGTNSKRFFIKNSLYKFARSKMKPEIF